MSSRSTRDGRSSRSQSQRLSSSDSDFEADFVPVAHKPPTKKRHHQTNTNKIVEHIKKKQPIFSPDVVSTIKIGSARSLASMTNDAVREVPGTSSSNTRFCSGCNRQVKEAIYSTHIINCLERFKFEKRPTPPDNERTSDEVCPVCFKNLRHLDTSERQVHINRCLDSLEELPDLEEPPAPPLMIGCPYCGHVSASLSTRQKHVKRCAKSRGVSTERVLQDMQLLQRQKEERQQAGLVLPTDQPRPAPARWGSSTRRVTKPPLTLSTADLQLAKAVSLSLFEEEQKRRALAAEDESDAYAAITVNGFHESDDSDAELVRALGIVDAPTKRGRRVRRKAAAGDHLTSKLLLCPPEERAAILIDRASRIVAPSPPPDGAEESVNPLEINWKLFADVPPLIAPLDRDTATPLWDYATLGVPYPRTSDSVMERSIASPAPGPDDVPVSTQALFDLFDTDSFSNRTQHCELSDLDDGGVGSDEVVCDGFFSQKMPDLDPANVDVAFATPNSDATSREESSMVSQRQSPPQLPTLVARLLAMVGESVTNDAYIVVSDGSNVPCHTQLLYATCRPLYDNLILAGNNLLDWSDISGQCATAFLQFAYTGTIVDDYPVDEMLLLARRYEIRELRRLVKRMEVDKKSFPAFWNDSDASGSGGRSKSRHSRLASDRNVSKISSDVDAGGFEDRDICQSAFSTIAKPAIKTKNSSPRLRRTTPMPDVPKAEVDSDFGGTDLLQKVNAAVEASRSLDVMAMVSAQFVSPVKNSTIAVAHVAHSTQESNFSKGPEKERIDSNHRSQVGLPLLSTSSPSSSPDIFADNPAPRKSRTARAIASTLSKIADSVSTTKKSDSVIADDYTLPDLEPIYAPQTSSRLKPKLTVSEGDSLVVSGKIRSASKHDESKRRNAVNVDLVVRSTKSSGLTSSIDATLQTNVRRPDVSRAINVVPELPRTQQNRKIDVGETNKLSLVTPPKLRKDALNSSVSSAASSDSPVFLIGVQRSDQTTSGKADLMLSGQRAECIPTTQQRISAKSENRSVASSKLVDRYSPLSLHTEQIPEYVPTSLISAGKGSCSQPLDMPNYVPSKKTDSPVSSGRLSKYSKHQLQKDVSNSSSSSGRSSTISPSTPVKVPLHVSSKMSTKLTVATESVSAATGMTSNNCSPLTGCNTARLLSRKSSGVATMTECERVTSSLFHVENFYASDSSHSFGSKEETSTRPKRTLIYDDTDTISKVKKVSPTGSTKRNNNNSITGDDWKNSSAFSVEGEDEEYVPGPAPSLSKKRKLPVMESSDAESGHAASSSSKKYREGWDTSFLSKAEAKSCSLVASAGRDRSIAKNICDQSSQRSDRSVVDNYEDVWAGYDDGFADDYNNWPENCEQENVPAVQPYSPGEAGITSTPKISKRHSRLIGGGDMERTVALSRALSPTVTFSDFDDTLPDLAPPYIPTKILPELTDKTITHGSKKGGAKKTTTAKIKITKKTACSPMLDYSVMATPEVESHLKKVGVRKLGKKAGVKILKHIYTETHPGAKGDIPESDDESGDGSGDQLARIPSPVIIGNKESSVQPNQSKKRAKVVGAEKTKPNKRATEEVTPIVLSEMILKYLRSNNELYHHLLQYKPIDIALIHNHLKSIGIKCKIEAVKDCLDQECISYLSTEESPRKRRSPKKRRK